MIDGFLNLMGALGVAWMFLVAGTWLGSKLFPGGLEAILPMLGVGVACAASWLAFWWWLL